MADRLPLDPPPQELDAAAHHQEEAGIALQLRDEPRHLPERRGQVRVPIAHELRLVAERRQQSLTHRFGLAQVLRQPPKANCALGLLRQPPQPLPWLQPLLPFPL